MSFANYSCYFIKKMSCSDEVNSYANSSVHKVPAKNVVRFMYLDVLHSVRKIGFVQSYYETVSAFLRLLTTGVPYNRPGRSTVLTIFRV